MQQPAASRPPIVISAFKPIRSSSAFATSLPSSSTAAVGGDATRRPADGQRDPSQLWSKLRPSISNLDNDSRSVHTEPSATSHTHAMATTPQKRRREEDEAAHDGPHDEAQVPTSQSPQRHRRSYRSSPVARSVSVMSSRSPYASEPTSRRSFGSSSSVGPDVPSSSSSSSRSRTSSSIRRRAPSTKQLLEGLARENRGSITTSSVIARRAGTMRDEAGARRREEEEAQRRATEMQQQERPYDAGDEFDRQRGYSSGTRPRSSHSAIDLSSRTHSRASQSTSRSSASVSGRSLAELSDQHRREMEQYHRKKTRLSYEKPTTTLGEGSRGSGSARHGFTQTQLKLRHEPLPMENDASPPISRIPPPFSPPLSPTRPPSPVIHHTRTYPYPPLPSTPMSSPPTSASPSLYRQARSRSRSRRLSLPPPQLTSPEAPTWTEMQRDAWRGGSDSDGRRGYTSPPLHTVTPTRRHTPLSPYRRSKTPSTKRLSAL